MERHIDAEKEILIKRLTEELDETKKQLRIQTEKSRKIAEDALHKAHEELKALNKELEKKIEDRTNELEVANEELKKRNLELEDFAFRVSHKLKNSILVLKRIMERQPEDTNELKANVALFWEQSDSLMEFVENLLQLARAGKVIDEKEEFDLNYMVKGIYTLRKPVDCEMELHIKNDLPIIRGDIQSLEQVFVNLFQNSCEHRDPDKGRLRIEIDHKKEDGRVIIFYRDNGEGIKPENLDKIFDVSYSSKGRKKFGFGMTINKKIIEAHGGSISVNSRGIRQGVEFVIDLPFRE